MAVKEFVAVNWSPNQLLDEDTMDQINNNMTYVRDQSMDGIYQHRLGGATDTGLKILCGTAGISARKAVGAGVTITFAKLFSPNSYPVVVATPISFGRRTVFLTINGIGRVLPNEQGFYAAVVVDNYGKTPGAMTNAIYISWIAMGY